MTSVRLTADVLQRLKYSARQQLPGIKSAHTSEALAAALGFRTHAALLAALPTDPDRFVPLDDQAFFRRLHELHPAFKPADENRLLFYDVYDGREILLTEDLGADIEYRTLRDRAWRNLLVAAINAGLEQKLFGLRAGDNRWPGSDADHCYRSSSATFEFGIGGVPAIGYVTDAGSGELRIHAAARPTTGAKNWISAGNAGFHAGDAFAASWLERQAGAWLEAPRKRKWSCRRALVARLGGIDVRAAGFGDRGRLM